MKIFLIIVGVIVLINLGIPLFSAIFSSGWDFSTFVVVLIIAIVVVAVIFAIRGFIRGDFSSIGSHSSYDGSSGSGKDSSSSSNEITEREIVEAIKNTLHCKSGTKCAIFYYANSYFPHWTLVDYWGQTETVEEKFNSSSSKYYFSTRDGKRYEVGSSLDKERVYYFDMI